MGWCVPYQINVTAEMLPRQVTSLKTNRVRCCCHCSREFYSRHAGKVLHLMKLCIN